MVLILLIDLKSSEYLVKSFQFQGIYYKFSSSYSFINNINSLNSFPYRNYPIIYINIIPWLKDIAPPILGPVHEHMQISKFLNMKLFFFDLNDLTLQTFHFLFVLENQYQFYNNLNIFNRFLGKSFFQFLKYKILNIRLSHFFFIVKI